MKKFCYLLAIALTLFITGCQTPTTTQQTGADTTANEYTVKLALVTKDIKFPVQVKTVPGDTQRLFIADLGGKIYIMKNGQLLPKPFLDITNKLENKDSTPAARGMYSMAFDPQFTTNHKFYVSYNAPTTIDSNKCKLVISQFETSSKDPDVADPATEHRIIEFEGHSIWQDAGEITFGPDGYFYISVGDNGTPMKLRKAEDLNNYMGKLLRIDISKLPYKIPADNPFVHTKGAKPEIWAYGLRRFWRFGYDSVEHAFMGGDIGDKIEEEIDTITKGGNYGWPYLEGDSTRVGKDTIATTPGLVAPLMTYHHKDGICVITGTRYRGTDIAFLTGKYMFADYNGTLYYITESNGNAWAKQKITVQDKPEDPFIINSCDAGLNNEIYLCGVLNTGKATPGAVYKIVKR